MKISFAADWREAINQNVKVNGIFTANNERSTSALTGATLQEIREWFGPEDTTEFELTEKEYKEDRKSKKKYQLQETEERTVDDFYSEWSDSTLNDYIRDFTGQLDDEDIFELSYIYGVHQERNSLKKAKDSIFIRNRSNPKGTTRERAIEMLEEKYPHTETIYICYQNDYILNDRIYGDPLTFNGWKDYYANRRTISDNDKHYYRALLAYVLGYYDAEYSPDNLWGIYQIPLYADTPIMEFWEDGLAVNDDTKPVEKSVWSVAFFAIKDAISWLHFFLHNALNRNADWENTDAKERTFYEKYLYKYWFAIECKEEKRDGNREATVYLDIHFFRRFYRRKDDRVRKPVDLENKKKNK